MWLRSLEVSCVLFSPNRPPCYTTFHRQNRSVNLKFVTDRVYIEDKPFDLQGLSENCENIMPKIECSEVYDK